MYAEKRRFSIIRCNREFGFPAITIEKSVSLRDLTLEGISFGRSLRSKVQCQSDLRICHSDQRNYDYSWRRAIGLDVDVWKVSPNQQSLTQTSSDYHLTLSVLLRTQLVITYATEKPIRLYLKGVLLGTEMMDLMGVLRNAGSIVRNATKNWVSNANNRKLRRSLSCFGAWGYIVENMPFRSKKLRLYLTQSYRARRWYWTIRISKTFF